MRINFWDFDDTLAHSSEADMCLHQQYPGVPSFMWWHNAEASTFAALQTKPMLPQWRAMGRMRGEHRILTARNLDAVMMWLDKHREAIPEIALLTDVISTSDPRRAHIRGDVKKAEHIRVEVLMGHDAYLIDDSGANLSAAEAEGATGLTPWSLDTLDAWKAGNQST